MGRNASRREIATERELPQTEPAEFLPPRPATRAIENFSTPGWTVVVSILPYQCSPRRAANNCSAPAPPPTFPRQGRQPYRAEVEYRRSLQRHRDSYLPIA